MTKVFLRKSFCSIRESAYSWTHPLLRGVVGHGGGPDAVLLIVHFGPRHRLEGVVGVREARYLHKLQNPHSKKDICKYIGQVHYLLVAAEFEAIVTSVKQEDS